MTPTWLDSNTGHGLSFRKLNVIEFGIAMIEISEVWIDEGFDRMVLTQDLGDKEMSLCCDSFGVLIHPAQQATVRHDVG